MKGRGIVGLAVLVVVLCLLGLIRMFLLRYESGDVYAPYSTFRTDPLGCKVLCESLRRLSDRTVSRNLRELSRWTGLETGQTILFAGYNLWRFRLHTEAQAERFQDLALRSNRVVIALSPTTMLNPNESDEEFAQRLEEWAERQQDVRRSSPDPNGEDTEKDEKTIENDRGPTTPEPANPWQIAFQFSPLTEKAEARQAEVILPDWPPKAWTQIPWNSTATFTDPGEEWSIIAHRNQMPVVLERRYGPGSVVLCTDSFFLSNEAQLRERSTDFLIWLLGSHRTIVFDETHLGVASRPGVAALIRQYRLHGFVAGLLLVAGLYIWKNLFSLVPRYRNGPVEHPAEVAGKDHAEGLVNLLQNHVPTRELIPECDRVWRKSERFLPPPVRAHQEQVRTLLTDPDAEAARRRPEDVYRRIQQLLTKQT